MAWRRSRAAFATLVLCACRSTPSTDSDKAPTASAPPASAAPFDVTTALGDAGAWTDASVVDALAIDCRAAPAPSSLACALLPLEGDVTHTPCLDEWNQCRASCGAACDACATTCGQTCDSCKAACAADAVGDACRRACAVTTARCRQTCVEARNQCITAPRCTRSGPCDVAEAQTWRALGCTHKCAAIRSCHSKCFETAIDPGECANICQRRWPGCNVWYCIIGPEPGSTR